MTILSCTPNSSINQHTDPNAPQSENHPQGNPQQDPFLRIEIGNHTERISRMSVDHNNQLLATGSNDKTVRVWDLMTGQLLQTLRPPIGLGNEGKIFAVAISPDGQTLACGGWTGLDWKRSFSVYIFNRLNGQIIETIDDLPSSIGDLGYSPDGRLLVVGLHGRHGIHIYRVPDYSLIALDHHYEPNSFVYGVSFDQKGRFVTTSYDGHVRLYGEDFSRLAERPTVEGRRPYGVSFSPNGNQIAVGFVDTPTIVLLSGADLSTLTTIANTSSNMHTGTFNSVTWSYDGEFLYGGGTARENGKHYIRKWSQQGHGPHTDIMATNDTILDIEALATGGIVFSASDGAFGTLDSDSHRLFDATVPIADFRDGHHNLLLSHDGTIIQFGYSQWGKIPARFSIQNRVLEQTPPQDRSLHPPLIATPGIDLDGWANTPHPTINGQPLQLRMDEVARSVAITPDYQSVLLGTSWNLRLFDIKGKPLWEIPISDNAWIVNISQDGMVAVAALGDGTIRWYRMKDGQEVLAFFPHPDRQRWVLWTPSGYYDASPGAETLIGWHKNYSADVAADFFPISQFRSVSYRPEIVEKVIEVWDEPQAIRLAGTVDNEIPSRKSEDSSTIPTTSLQQLAVLQQRWETQLQEKETVQPLTPSPTQDAGEERERFFTDFPPQIIILSPSEKVVTALPTVTIRYAVFTHPQAPITSISTFVDDKPVAIPTIRGIQVLGKRIQGQDVQEIHIPIPRKNCVVTVQAKHQWATSQPATIEVEWVSDEAFPIKPNLYVVAVGVSEFDDPTLNLQFPAQDAQTFSDTMQRQAGNLYREVHVKTLTNRQTSKNNILDALDWIDRETTSKDIAMLFFAGHSVSDKRGIPHFLTFNADLEQLRRTSLPFSDIQNTMIPLSGKSILFFDTCQLNTPVGLTGCGNSMMFLENSLTSSTNDVVLFSAISENQRAIDDPSWDHGSFTSALLEGITGKADDQSTGMITINMIDLYLSERVKSLTQGHQRPTTIKPTAFQDFPMALNLHLKAPPAPSTESGEQPPAESLALPLQPIKEILRRLPPVVTILSPRENEVVSSTDLTIRYTTRSPSGEPLTQVMPLIDGRPAPTYRGITVLGRAEHSQHVRELRIKIPERDVSLSLLAKNRWATSEPSTVKVRWRSKEGKDTVLQKPNLYVLAIGISTYQDPSLTLQFAAKDAADFAHALKNQIGGLYNQVFVKRVTDTEATKDQILAGLDWLDRTVTDRDVAMILLAGHGVNDKGGIYYFLPVDADTTRLRRTSLPFSDIRNIVISLAGKTILFVDSCHSGNVMGMRRGVADINALVNELASAENGAVVFASSTGRQYALEDPSWGNGAFTKALLEGLQGKADFRHTGTITVNMLDLFLSERVKALTGGQQTPTTTKPRTIQDFPIALTVSAG